MLRVKHPYPNIHKQTHKAKQWRRVWASLRRYPLTIQSHLVGQWKLRKIQDDPRLLLAVIHKYDNGKLPLTSVSVDKIDNIIRDCHN